jgi:hypothetical protein
MLVWLLFGLLIVLASVMLGWGLLRPERFYQYPTLAGGTWICFMGPQITGALRNPDKYPQMVLSDSGLETALLMSIFCIACGWLGYLRPISFRNRPVSTLYPSRSLFQAGVALYLVGFFGAYKLAQFAGGFISQFTEGGHYEMEWRGLPVLYSAFSQMIYPGLLLTLLATLRHPAAHRIIAVALFSAYPLAVSVLLGRRTTTAFLCLIFLLAFLFVRNWTPPRWMFVSGLAFGSLFILLAPQYREISQYGFRTGEISQIQVKASVEGMLNGTVYAEFDALVVTAAAVNRTGILDLGKGFYNSTIAQLIPRQFLGEEFKESLFLKSSKEDIAYNSYRWSIPYGSTPTGPSNAFSEFWYFGALLYYGIGLFSRLLWERAVTGSLTARVWYAIWAIMIPESIYGSLLILPGRVLFYLLFLWPFFKVLRSAAEPLDSAKESVEDESRPFGLEYR